MAKVECRLCRLPAVDVVLVTPFGSAMLCTRHLGWMEEASRAWKAARDVGGDPPLEHFDVMNALRVSFRFGTVDDRELLDEGQQPEARCY